MKPPATCTECGRPDDGRRGWKAYLGGGVFGDPEEAFLFCPECAEREFESADGGSAPELGAFPSTDEGELPFGN